MLVSFKCNSCLCCVFFSSVLSYVSLSSLAPAANIWFSFNAYGHYTAIDLFSRYMANYFTYLVLFTMHKAQINYTQMQRRMCFGAWWVWNMCGKTCWTDNLAISLSTSVFLLFHGISFQCAVCTRIWLRIRCISMLYLILHVFLIFLIFNWHRIWYGRKKKWTKVSYNQGTNKKCTYIQKQTEITSHLS